MKSEETMAKDHEPKREELSADAKPFRPGQDIQTPNQRYGHHPRSIGVCTRRMYEVLDHVPFTPSQGICTPSPTNMAVLVSAPGIGMHPAEGYLPSPVASPSAHMLVSHQMQGDMGYGNENLLPSGSPQYIQAVYYQPAHGYPAQQPQQGEMYHRSPGQVTGVERRIKGSPADAVRRSLSPASAGTPVSRRSTPNAFVGSPSLGAPESQGRRMFDKYLAHEGHALIREPYEDSNRALVGKEPVGPHEKDEVHMGAKAYPARGDDTNADHVDQALHRTQSKLLNNVDLDSAMELAAEICDMEGIEPPMDMPKELMELASLLISYSIPKNLATFPAAKFGSPVKGKKRDVLQPGDGVRLNARQRRTLRRAQERAMQILDMMRVEKLADVAANGPQYQEDSHHHIGGHQPPTSMYFPMQPLGGAAQCVSYGIPPGSYPEYNCVVMHAPPLISHPLNRPTTTSKYVVQYHQPMEGYYPPVVEQQQQGKQTVGYATPIRGNQRPARRLTRFAKEH